MCQRLQECLSRMRIKPIGSAAVPPCRLVQLQLFIRALRKAAALDTSQWMSRFSFKLGHHDPELDMLPTDERLARVAAGGDDLGLQQLYFEYARYLLVGSSRPGGLPANLQGIWAGGINNPWGSKWTININAEMNYWLAEPSNLGELNLPLVDLDELVRTPGSGTGQEVAKKYYGARGFVAHHNTDIWGDAHPIDLVGSGIWPMGAAWLTLDAWEHYAYNLDSAYLRNRAYPLLHDASLFFLDYLVDDGHGHLVTGPSISPENRYKLSDGSMHSVTMGPTMDIEIVRELFERTVQASEILQIDPLFRAQVQAAQAKLPPLQIGRRGNLQEWPLDYDDAEPGHRHISHLWALYPGSQITLDHTPELARAAQTTLEARLSNGGGQTGWSRAWVINYWDHLHNGEQAYDSMEVMFKQSTFPNMMDTHPPGLFQIDGNLGAAAGMLEALVQSRWYSDHAEVDLMPALPPKWQDGEVTGVRVRGGGELHLQWAGGKVVRVEWRCTHTRTVDLRLPAGQTLRSLRADGKSISYTQADSVVHMNLTARPQLRTCVLAIPSDKLQTPEQPGKGKYMMKTNSPIVVLLTTLAASAGPLASQTHPAHPVIVSSPDGRMRAELSVSNGMLRYRIVVDGKQVLAPSRIGIESDDVELGQGVTLGSAKSRKVDEHYHLFGAHAEAVNHANEATVPALSHGQSYLVDVHVANDGVGVRLRLPAKTERRVQADRSSSLNLPRDVS